MKTVLWSSVILAFLLLLITLCHMAEDLILIIYNLPAAVTMTREVFAWNKNYAGTQVHYIVSLSIASL